MARDSRRPPPRRAGFHRAGMRRAGMASIGGDGADTNSELVLVGLRALAQQIEALTDEDRLQAIVGSLGALAQIGEIVAPQQHEIVQYMSTHDADEAHDERMLTRIDGFLAWVNQLTPAEIVSLVAASASLLDLVKLAHLDAPDEILELFEPEQ